MKKLLLLLLAIAFYCIAVFAKTLKVNEVTEKAGSSQSLQNKSFD
jgi:hypothetical protein